jgi:hypothetical protein
MGSGQVFGNRLLRLLEFDYTFSVYVKLGTMPSSKLQNCCYDTIAGVILLPQMLRHLRHS